MGYDLQKLRDEAERRCLVCRENHDKDTADAWERIGVVLDDALQKIKADLRVIESRTGLFGLHAP